MIAFALVFIGISIPMLIWASLEQKKKPNPNLIKLSDNVEFDGHGFKLKKIDYEKLERMRKEVLKDLKRRNR